MKTCSALLILAKVLVIGTLVGCGTPPGKLRVDTPILTYQSPDIADITGIEEPDSDEPGDETSTAQSGSASAPGK